MKLQETNPANGSGAGGPSPAAGNGNGTSSEGIKKRGALWVAFAFVAAVILCLFLFSPDIAKDKSHWRDFLVLPLLVNLLTAAVVALIAVIIYERSDFESVGMKLGAIYDAVTARPKPPECSIAGSCLFKDVQEVVELLQKGGEHASVVVDFFPALKKLRQDSVKGSYVFPLTNSTYDYFIRTQGNEEYFHEEREFLKLNPAFALQRVVIIDRGLDRSEKIKSFLRDHKDSPWKVILRDELTKDQRRLFRNFCVFESQDRKRRALFTYLDPEHSNLFTKGSWAQYRTSNPGYTCRLQTDFDTLWNSDDAKPVSDFLLDGAKVS